MPSAIGANLAQNKRWRDLTSEEFYSRGYDQPDAYALQIEVEEAREELEELKTTAQDLKNARKEIASLKANVKKLKSRIPPRQKPQKVTPTREKE